jgi:hypothetical protein
MTQPHKIAELSVVRTLVDVTTDDKRTVPAGTTATVVHAGDDYYILDISFEPQTETSDGDFEQAVVTPDQIELVSSE